MSDAPRLADVLRDIRLSELQTAFRDAGIRLELTVGATRLFEVGDVLHGPCRGVFGPDVRGCPRVVGVGRDWLVVRGPEYGQPVALAQGRALLESLIKFRIRPEPIDGAEACCEV